MVNPEAIAIEAQEPNILPDALRARPVLPIGACAILDYFTQEMGTQSEAPHGYAWTRLAIWFINRDSYRDVDAASVVCMSLCPSFPFENLLRMGEELHRRGRKAEGFVRGLLSESSIQQLKTSESTAALVPLAVALTRHSKGRNAKVHPTSRLARGLLVSAIHKSLFEITPAEHSDLEQLEGSLRSAMLSQDCVYAQHRIPGDLESSWGVRYEYGEVGETYLQILSSLGVPSPRALRAREQLRSDPQNNSLHQLAKETVPAGEELARHYIEWKVGQVAAMVIGNPRFRPFRSLSRDIASADVIAEGSWRNLPQSLLESNIATHAFAALYNHQQHTQGDVYERLPVPDGSLALITNIDGMPYHSSLVNTPAEVARFKAANLQMLIRHYAKLAGGAEHVIFPWDVANGSPEQLQALDEIIFDFVRQTGQSVDRRLFHLSTLRDWMSEADVQIARELSPIFQSGRRHFEALIARKPRESVTNYSELCNNQRIDLPSGGDIAPAVAKLHKLYEEADFGSEIIVCPWGIADGRSEQVRVVDKIAVELARREHHGVDVRLFHRSAFSKPPSDDEYFITIAMTKPRESLVEVHERALENAAKASGV